MKRLISLTLALLMALALFGAVGAKTYAYAEGEAADPAAEPAAEPEAQAEAEAEAEEPINPYLGLWEITGYLDEGVYSPYAETGAKAYLDFLPNGAIYAVMIDSETVDDDYLAYVVTGESTLDVYEGEDGLPSVYDPETGVITVTEPNSGLVTYVERVKEDPLPDIRALVDHTKEERTWYGYEMSQSGQTINLLEMLPTMDMDPHDFYLTLNADGTGYLQFGDEEAGGEIIWTEDQLIPKENPEEPVTYTWVGDHLQFEVEGMIVEFAPEGECEALLAVIEAKAAAEPKAEPVEFSPEDVVGSWEFTKAKAYGTEIPAEQVGTTMSLVLKADGKASMTTNGTPNNSLEWKIEDGSIVLGVGTYEAFRLTFDGTVLTLSTMGVDMIFERVG